MFNLKNEQETNQKPCPQLKDLTTFAFLCFSPTTSTCHQCRLDSELKGSRSPLPAPPRPPVLPLKLRPLLPLPTAPRPSTNKVNSPRQRKRRRKACSLIITPPSKTAAGLHYFLFSILTGKIQRSIGIISTSPGSETTCGCHLKDHRFTFGAKLWWPLRLSICVALMLATHSIPDE